MRAGELRSVVTIERNSAPTQTSTGELVPGWTVFAVVHAAIAWTGGAEPTVGDHRIAVREGTVTLRYLAGVDPKTMRLRYVGRVFDILSALDVEERHRELELTVEERT